MEPHRRVRRQAFRRFAAEAHLPQIEGLLRHRRERQQGRRGKEAAAEQCQWLCGVRRTDGDHGQLGGGQDDAVEYPGVSVAARHRDLSEGRAHAERPFDVGVGVARQLCVRPAGRFVHRDAEHEGASVVSG